MIEYLKERTRQASNGCLLWTLGTNRGYARARVAGKMKYIHRELYEFHYGHIPSGYDVDHTCHNLDTSCPGGVKCQHRRCLNIQHLEAVTKKTNQNRGQQRSRNWNKTHCPKGHPYDEENTFWYTNKQNQPARQCKECRRFIRRAYYRRVGR